MTKTCPTCSTQHNSRLDNCPTCETAKRYIKQSRCIICDNDVTGFYCQSCRDAEFKNELKLIVYFAVLISVLAFLLLIAG